MKVVDTKKSEVGWQPKKASNGRLLHCCCICGKLETWGDTWSTYCSVKDMDDVEAIPKFCSEWCQKAGGPKASNVTSEMKQRARDSEWREPVTVWREATESEKYHRAAAEQRKRRDNSLER